MEIDMETRSRRSTIPRHITRSQSAEDQSIETTPSFKGVAGQGSEAVSTPLLTPGLKQLRQRIEEELGKVPTSGPGANKASPGLTRLRNTPGPGLKKKQQELIYKHEQIRQHSDKLSIGGGVALWPNMNQMRLSAREMVFLALACLVLMAVTGCFFHQLHGKTIEAMWQLTAAVKAFGQSHPIRNTGFHLDLKSSVLAWHADFRQLMTGVDRSLNVTRPSIGYQLYIAAYLTALAILLYFLLDNMFSKSKLSPGRIKKWVCLLVVMAQWTLLLFVMFLSAHRLEAAIVDNVYQLSEKLGEFVERDLDLSTLLGVIQYWRGRCLLSAGGQGVVTVLGVMGVQEAWMCLQYYSLPVLTVLLTPVLRLCLALRGLYTHMPQP